jgi:hypothetical protein
MIKQIQNENRCLKKIILEQPPADLTDLNHLFYATAAVLSKDKIRSKAVVSNKPNNSTPKAQTRIEKQISTWRKELSWIHAIVANGTNVTNDRSARLHRKHR